MRELLTVVLGVLFGGVLVIWPEAALRLSVFGGANNHRRGRYGDDTPISNRWAWGVRLLGVGCLVIAGFLAFQAYG